MQQRHVGVLGYVTNHGYLDNPTFRGMRQCLTSTFPFITVVDLHGNSKKKEVAPDGGKDENVFDIEQGVAIGLMRTAGVGAVKVRHKDMFGIRTTKYDELMRGITVTDLPFKGPVYFFVPKENAFADEYAKAWLLPQMQPVNTSGIVTARDHFAISFDQSTLEAKIDEFLDSRFSDDEIREHLFKGMGSDKYPDGDSRGWKVPSARKALKGKPWRADITDILYRPFDTRKILYRSDVVDWPRTEVMGHMIEGNNFAISVPRGVEIVGDYEHVMCSRLMGTHHTVSIKEVNYFFPVWIHAGGTRISNFADSFVTALQSALNLTPADYRPEDPAAPLHAEKIFHYIYAVLHSPAYRQRYAAFLRTDFPRIPIPASRAVFDALAKLGAQLVQWHLLEHPAAQAIGGSPSLLPAGKGAHPRWFGADFSLQKVGEKSKSLADLSGTDDQVGKVFINATSGFAHVRQSVWLHTIGGYQVLHKWLADRCKAGRSLSHDDITHWLRVYAALDATQTLMQQVDEAIEAHGGWPDAFSQNHPPPDAATLAAEQAAQKEQLKAQKKAAAKKVVKDAGTPWTGGLFDSDSDLDEMAAAAGAPPHPKSEAAPAKAAGGKTSSVTPRARDMTDDQLMCALRAVLTRSDPLTRDDLIRQTARKLGFAHLGAPIREVLDNAIRRAVRRGITVNTRGMLSLAIQSIEGYDRDFLKLELLKIASNTGQSQNEVTVQLARRIGFARVGPVIESTVLSLLRALVRQGEITAAGRGAAALYCRA